MPYKINYISGQQIGTCVFLNDEDYITDSSGQKRRMGKFLCKCGNTFICSFDAIKRQTKSCGCLHKQVMSKISFKHGNSSKERKSVSGYGCWINMIERCTVETNISYHNYGGKGIKVCDRWMDYNNFLEDMGQRPSLNHSIDRWPNVKGNYEPSNCRWATRKEQSRNKNNTLFVDFKGVLMPLADVCDIFKIPYGQTFNRMFKQNLSLYKAISRGITSIVYPRKRIYGNNNHKS